MGDLSGKVTRRTPKINQNHVPFFWRSWVNPQIYPNNGSLGEKRLDAVRIPKTPILSTGQIMMGLPQDSWEVQCFLACANPIKSKIWFPILGREYFGHYITIPNPNRKHRPGPLKYQPSPWDRL